MQSEKKREKNKNKNKNKLKLKLLHTCSFWSSPHYFYIHAYMSSTKQRMDGRKDGWKDGWTGKFCLLVRVGEILALGVKSGLT
jgi:hypothetical protein